MSGAAFPNDPGELVTRAVTEGQLIQTVNTSEVEVAGIMGLVGRFVDIEQNAAAETGNFASQQISSEQRAITHGVAAENAGDNNTYSSNASAAVVSTAEAAQHAIKSGAAASEAAEAGAKAAALEQVSNVTLAQIEREMKLHSVIEEEVKRSTAAAELDLEAQAAPASVDKDATTSPFKPT